MKFNFEIDLGHLLTLIAILIAFFGHRIWGFIDNCRKMKHVKAIMLENLGQLRSDLIRIIEKRNTPNSNSITFNPTSLSEISGYYYLFSELLLPNLEQLKLSAYPKTIRFFNHYKINMETLKVRYDISHTNSSALTRGTVNNLLTELEQSIEELK